MMSLLSLVQEFMQLYVCTLSDSKIGFSGLQRYFFLKTCILINNYFYYPNFQNLKSMELQAPINSARAKSDRVYYQAFTHHAGLSKMSIFFNVIKSIAFITLIPVNLIAYDLPYSDLITCFIVNLTASIYCILVQGTKIAYGFNSIIVYLNVADQTKHTVTNETITNPTTIEECVSSTIYQAQNQITQQDLSQQGREVYLNLAKKAIDSALRNRYTWYKNGQNLSSTLSFGSMIYTIVILCMIDMNALDKTILSIYVVVVGLSEIKQILILILIAISPLICLFLLFYCCCCVKNRSENAFIDAPSRNATTTDIFNAGGDCSICYQSITVEQKIFILECSQKHVFHCDCLNHWIKVKNTCPICRKQIKITDHERIEEGSNAPVIPQK